MNDRRVETRGDALTEENTVEHVPCSRQKSYLAMALGLMMLSLLGLLRLVLATNPSRNIADMSYWLALSLPAVPVVLCLWTMRRVFDKGRRRRSSTRTFISNRQ